jgi:ADP-ribose 1''-phosphate phosphatase
MSTKRSISPPGAARALKQTKLHFGKKMATPADNQPQHRMSTKEEEPTEAGKFSKPSQNDSDVENENTPAVSLAQEVTTKETKETLPPPETLQLPPNSKKFVITDRVGDIFDAPDNAVIIHACNCLGSWAAGIAAAFRQRYPKAFAKCVQHCKTNTPNSLWGTALLIPPMETKGPRHYVGCVFTSRRYGRGKDSPAQILAKTGPAMEELVEMMRKATVKEVITEIRICQINSGLFAVPWEKSKSVIEELEAGEGDLPKEIIVYSLPTV